MTVLVDDDDPNLRRRLAEALVETGCAVDVADNGEDGHHLGDSEPYDAVILDFGLPVVDGVTVLERWRRSGSRWKLAVSHFLVRALDRENQTPQFTSITEQ